jgi:hypothetical protein
MDLLDQVMEKVEWGWVVMGKPKQFERWQKDWQRSCAEVHIVNNKNGDIFGSPGSNSYYEFSGYLELAKSMRTEGPYIVANDTWFKTHHSILWSRLLRHFLKTDFPKDCVFGDIRTEPSTFVEKPSPYLSSWIFFIPNRMILQQFQGCLERAIVTSRESRFSSEYLEYVENWLQPKNPFYGWHNPSSDALALQRKRKCVYIEHQLNIELLKAGLNLVSLGQNQKWRYTILRIIDRLQTRLNAWGLFPFT